MQDSTITCDFTKISLDGPHGKLIGCYARPHQLDTCRTVIYVHGYDSTYDSGLTYAQCALANKCGFIAFDFCGGSRQSRSEGSPLDMSVMTEAEELQYIVDTVSQWDWVEDIILLGASQGGAVSAEIAHRNPHSITALMLLYPAFSIADDTRKGYEKLKQKDPNATIPERTRIMNMEVGKAYCQDVLEYDQFTTCDYPQPVLIIHGDKDRVIPLHYSQRAQNEYKNAQLITLAGADHSFKGRYMDQACEAMTRFLANLPSNSIKN